MEYRSLSLNEVTKKGDQRFNPQTKTWEDVILIGNTCEWINPFLEYRRPIDNFSLTCSDCGTAIKQEFTCIDLRKEDPKNFICQSCQGTPGF